MSALAAANVLIVRRSNPQNMVDVAKKEKIKVIASAARWSSKSFQGSPISLLGVDLKLALGGGKFRVRGSDNAFQARRLPWKQLT